jgi:hypothetical protein
MRSSSLWLSKTDALTVGWKRTAMVSLRQPPGPVAGTRLGVEPRSRTSLECELPIVSIAAFGCQWRNLRRACRGAGPDDGAHRSWLGHQSAHQGGVHGVAGALGRHTR